MADMRGQLILINGHGGAGKYTNAELLHTQLDGSAWIHMRWLLRIRSWGPTDEYAELGNSNAAAVINNYLSQQVPKSLRASAKKANGMPKPPGAGGDGEQDSAAAS